MRRFRKYFRTHASRRADPLVFRAHLMLRSGDFEAAAALFEQLAGKVDPYEVERTTDYYVQAGRARLLSGQPDTGLRLLKQGMSLLVKENRLEELGIVIRRLVSNLIRLGLDSPANAIAYWTEDMIQQPGLAASLITLPPPAPSASVILPVQCFYCGAPVHQKEVEWVDSQTAICPYCGGLLRGEVR